MYVNFIFCANKIGARKKKLIDLTRQKIIPKRLLINKQKYYSVYWQYQF